MRNAPQIDGGKQCAQVSTGLDEANLVFDQMIAWICLWRFYNGLRSPNNY